IRRPFRSIRPTISPTRPRATPSGLTNTRVLSDTRREPSGSPDQDHREQSALEHAQPAMIKSASTKAQPVRPDHGEDDADDVHRPRDDPGADHEDLYDRAGRDTTSPAQPGGDEDQQDGERGDVDDAGDVHMTTLGRGDGGDSQQQDERLEPEPRRTDRHQPTWWRGRRPTGHDRARG